jgi:hypothetical protein
MSPPAWLARTCHSLNDAFGSKVPGGRLTFYLSRRGQRNENVPAEDFVGREGVEIAAPATDFQGKERRILVEYIVAANADLQAGRQAIGDGYLRPLDGARLAIDAARAQVP